MTTEPTRLAFVFAIGLLIPRIAHTSSVTVPDHLPSVQAAIDFGSDTVLVREGEYTEVPQAYRGVTILGLGGRHPRLGGLRISNPHGHLSREWRVEGVDFAGPVTIETPNWQNRLLDISFENSRLLGGVQHDHLNSSDPYDIYNFRLIHCSVGAFSYGRSANLEMRADTVDAGISWGAFELASVDSSWFRGGSREALQIWGDLVICRVQNNLLEDARKGFSLANSESVTVRSNVVRRMIQAGMEIRGREGLIDGNSIEDCGTGLWSSCADATVTNNTCVRMRDMASYFLLPDRVHAEGNIIGNCGGAAVWIQSPFRADLVFRRNTVYGAGGSGIVVADGAENSLAMDRNIVFGSSEFGLHVATSLVSSAFDCNDWFGNGRGALRGVAESSTDLAIDPGFCDVTSDDVRLYSDSPLLSQAQCGGIGARGVGCSPPALKALSVESVRAGLEIAWEFQAASTVESWVERADLAVGPWDSLGMGRPMGGNSFELLDTAVAPDRGYHYRVAWRDRGAVVRGSSALATWSDAGRLSRVAPNPGFGEVIVEWVLGRPSATDVRIFDLAGREVSIVARGTFDVGRHQVRWNGRWDGRGIAPAGMYIVRISNGERTTSHRILLLR